MIHTVFHLLVSEEMNTYIPGGGHFEFYAKWPTEIDHNLFAMVFETFTPIPNTVPNLKNLAPSARFDLYLVYSSPASCFVPIRRNSVLDELRSSLFKFIQERMSVKVVVFQDLCLETWLMSCHLYVDERQHWSLSHPWQAIDIFNCDSQGLSTNLIDSSKRKIDQKTISSPKEPT